VAVACLIGLGAVALATHARAATDKEVLARDFKAYHKRCDKVTESDEALYRKCADDKAALIHRQKDLNLSDAELAKLMNPSVEFRGGTR
jgi:hypothetical protein